MRETPAAGHLTETVLEVVSTEVVQEVNAGEEVGGEVVSDIERPGGGDGLEADGQVDYANLTNFSLI